MIFKSAGFELSCFSRSIPFINVKIPSLSVCGNIFLLKMDINLKKEQPTGVHQLNSLNMSLPNAVGTILNEAQHRLVADKF